ncbi:MAG: hypothetical protein II992_13000 [Lachnospiraceae bacterium]|nr:hypothetical protein [Lachnospiraceae bacterium]
MTPKGYLIIDENTIYEVDMECAKCREEENRNESKDYRHMRNIKEETLKKENK